MKTLKIFLLALLSLQVGYGQVLTFFVSDYETDLPLEGVEIFSHKMRDKMTHTSKEGYAKYDVKKTDTLVFFKSNYASFYMHIKHSNFDTTHHIIQVKMRANSAIAGRQVPSQFNTLDKQLYVFAHDSLSENNIEITHYLESQAYLPKDASFHLIDVQLNKNSNRRKGYSRK